MPTPPKSTYGDGWRQTGRWRWRKRLFRRPCLEAEMVKDVWAPRLGNVKHMRQVSSWWEARPLFDFPSDGEVSSD